MLFQFLKKIQSYYYGFDSDRIARKEGQIIPVSRLEKIGEFTCYHRYGGYYGCLRPGVDEVLRQLPKDIDITKVDAFELSFPSLDFRTIYDAVLDRHVSTVILYHLPDGLPDDIAKHPVFMKEK